MPDPKSRARVERILRGNFRPDDLTALFLYTRDHCDGREAVMDIGDFVAHHNERNKGITTRATRDWFTTVRFHTVRFGPGGPYPMLGHQLPEASKDYLRIAADRIDRNTIRRATGLGQTDAARIANGLAERLSQNADRTWSLPRDITKEEFNLLECLASHLVVKPAFDGIRIVNEFIETLKSNGLISREEIRQHSSSLSDLIQLYSVSTMHNCIVRIDGHNKCKLKARINQDEISVVAAVPSAARGYPGVISVACDMFCAKLNPTVHCHPDLLATQTWDFEIEVSPEKLLAPLR